MLSATGLGRDKEVGGEVVCIFATVAGAVSMVS